MRRGCRVHGHTRACARGLDRASAGSGVAWLARRRRAVAPELRQLPPSGAAARARPYHRRSPSTRHLPSTSPPRTHVPSTYGCSPWFYLPPGTSSISTSSTTRRRGVPSPTSRAKLRTTFCERYERLCCLCHLSVPAAFTPAGCRRPTYGFNGSGRSTSAGARQPRPSTYTGLFKYHMCAHSTPDLAATPRDQTSRGGSKWGKV